MDTFQYRGPNYKFFLLLDVILKRVWLTSSIFFNWRFFLKKKKYLQWQVIVSLISTFYLISGWCVSFSLKQKEIPIKKIFEVSQTFLKSYFNFLFFISISSIIIFWKVIQPSRSNISFFYMRALSIHIEFSKFVSLFKVNNLRFLF